MEAIKQMNLKVLRSKNTLMFITFLISIIADEVYGFVNHSGAITMSVLGFEFLGFILLFLILQKVVKKEHLFPYLV